jgi:hypothetical protein
MERPTRIFALLLTVALTACAVGDNGDEGADGASIALDGDEQDAPVDDVATVDDAAVDSGLDPVDVASPPDAPTELDASTSLDAPVSPDRTFIPPDVITVDGPRLDATVPVDAPATLDVPVVTDVPAGTDVPVGTDGGCPAGASTCAGACVVHSANNDMCGGGVNLGSYCGDNACDFLCGSTSYRTVGTARTGLTSTWFRARAVECSICPGATILARVTLVSPPGVDYNLFVYRACGASAGSSTAGAGAQDRVEVRESDSAASSDTFDYYIEVRHVSGASCSPWRLTLEARSNNGSSC